jgi:hypothetical protein
MVAGTRRRPRSRQAAVAGAPSSHGGASGSSARAAAGLPAATTTEAARSVLAGVRTSQVPSVLACSEAERGDPLGGAQRDERGRLQLRKSGEQPSDPDLVEQPEDRRAEQRPGRGG